MARQVFYSVNTAQDRQDLQCLFARILLRPGNELCDYSLANSFGSATQAGADLIDGCEILGSDGPSNAIDNVVNYCPPS